MSKTLKSLAAGAAIVASIGAGANSHVSADEVVSNPDASTETVVSTTEIKVAKEAKTAEDVKPALDAQKDVVKSAQADVEAAKSEVTTAKTEVESTQEQADTADQAVKDAESAMTNATPENIAANQDEQALNLQDQKDNATDTENVNKAIVDQQAKVASAQADVDTAKSEKDQADASVKAAESEVASAQDALSGKGLESAKETLNQANQDVKSAEANVASAQDALTKAKQDSQEREAAIKAAQTDVNVKTDAVNTASAKVSAAQSKVASSNKNLQSATEAVKAAQDALNALSDVDTVSIGDLTDFKAAYEKWKVNSSDEDNIMTVIGEGVNASETSSVTIRESDKTRSVDVTNMTDKQLIELSQLYAKALTDLRQKFGSTSVVNTSQEAINIAKEQAAKYLKRGTNPIYNGHVGLADGQSAENVSTAGTINTLYDLKKETFEVFEGTSFLDEPSKWGHLLNNLTFGSKVGVAPVQINGDNFIIVAFTGLGEPITNNNDTAQLEAALKQAKADQAAAQTAADAAKAELAKVSADYATALELKTKAEKVLADAMATPLQTQVAENNLRLANLALQNAKERQVAAQAAVDNFSADLGTKEAALESAKAKLAEAQIVANDKAQALEVAKAELNSQENTLQLLNDDKAQLLAEKDRLVEEAKALAKELDSYLNAESNLATAKANQEAAQTALKEAQAKLDKLELKLADVTARLEDETAILAELQAEYDSLKALEPKEDTSNDTKVTLPDGKTITVSKDTTKPSAKAEETSDAATLARLKAVLAAHEALQKSHTDEKNQALYNAVDAYIHQDGAVKKTAESDDEVGMLARKLGYVSLGAAPSENQKAEALNFIKSEIARLEAKLAKGKGNVANKGQLTTSKATPMTGVSQWNSVTVTKPQAGVTVTTTANGSTTSYSRVARAEALPQTGEQESLVALLGVAVLSGLGLTGVRRKRMG